MKSDEYEGQPLVVLPAKVIALQQMQFSEEEEAIYRAFEEKSQLDFKEYVREGFGANYSHILVRDAHYLAGKFLFSCQNRQGMTFALSFCVQFVHIPHPEAACATPVAGDILGKRAGP